MFDPTLVRRLMSPLLLCAAVLLLASACDDGDSAPANSFDTDADESDTTEPDTGEPDTGGPDTDEPDTNDPDTTTDTGGDTTADSDTTTDTSPGVDATQPLPTQMPVDYQAIATDNAMTSALAVDFTGDGLLDLAGLDATGQLVLVTTGRDANGDTTFGTPRALALATGDTPRLLRTGDFNGDGSADLAAWDPATGGVSIGVNTGAAFDNPIIAFDNPIIAFDNPIIAFDNPIIAFDNPIIATESSWAVGDFDGSGNDDLAFFAGTKGVSVAWSDAAGAAFDLAQPTGLSDFDNPIIATPVAGAALDATGDGNTDLVVGFALADNAQFDGLGFFAHDGSQGFDNPIIAFDNPIIASPGGGDLQGVTKGLSTVKAGELNGDGTTDLAWMSAPSGGATAGGVWLTMGFDNPIIATDPDRVSFAGDGAQLEFGRLLIDQAIGTGASGALDLLDAYAHVLILPPEGSTADAIAIPVLNDGGGLGRIVELGNAGGLGQPFDIDGDGFSEFLRFDTTGLQVGRQESLDNLTEITLADGTTVQLCELAAGYCDGGARGVCAYGRDVCGTCTPSDDFATDFPGLTFADVYQPAGEMACEDQLDNDCDGIIDELFDAAQLDFPGLPATIERFEVFKFPWAHVLFWSETVGGEMSWAVYDQPGMVPSRSGTTGTTDDTTIFDADDTGVVWYGTSAGSPNASVLDATGEYIIEGSFFSPTSVAVDMDQFYGWLFATEDASITVTSSTGGFFNKTVTQTTTVAGGVGTYDSGTVYTIDQVATDTVIEAHAFDAFMGFELNGSPVSVYSTPRGVTQTAVDGSFDYHCLAVATTDSTGTDHRLELVATNVVFDVETSTFTSSSVDTIELGDRPVLPGSLQVRIPDASTCHVSWLEPGSQASGIQVVREAIYNPFLLELYRNQRLATANIRGAERFSVSVDVTADVHWLPEGSTQPNELTMCVPFQGL